MMDAGLYGLSVEVKVGIAVAVAALAYGLGCLLASPRTRMAAQWAVVGAGFGGSLIGIFVLPDAAWATNALACWTFVFAGAIVLAPLIMLTRRKRQP